MSPKAGRKALAAALFLLSAVLAMLYAVGPSPAHHPLIAGEEAQGPWWMKQTAMTKDGTIARLSDMPWWEAARRLKLDESFIIEAEGEAKGRMLVRRERFKIRTGEEVEGIIWVIDDDGDGSLSQGGDGDSDCYVADYGCDGIVDRLVDYMDNDGDQVPDEMDIRYFEDGRLNRALLRWDIKRDGNMWKVGGYEYNGDSYFESDAYGDNIFCMNKFNSDNGVWSPIGECPFAFYDLDGDGYGEIVVRVSAAPLDYRLGQDPDYVNTTHLRPWGKEMARMGVVNIRYSFDVDGLSGKDNPLHYDAGFNLVGALPYEFPGMGQHNSKRRPPQETVVMPWKDVRAIANAFPARETGFSWFENTDESRSIGYGEHKKENFRWEGVFWIWERRFMGNSGGPCQKYNIRREWTSKPQRSRELYYSGVDRRIHLFGAEEGWLEIGHFGGLGKIGEVRMLDTDQNGYFDRWEVCLEGEDQPMRVTTVRDERARRVPFDEEYLYRPYATEILPEAMAANTKLMKAMDEALPFELPEGLRRAMAEGPDNFRRYAQDVSRELQYQNLRDHFRKRSQAVLSNLENGPDYARDSGDLHEASRATGGDLDSTPNSHTAWKLERALMELDQAYGQGDFDRACELIGDIRKIRAFQ